MNIVERKRTSTAEDAAQAHAADNPPAPAPARAGRLRPLRLLIPYLRCYPWQVSAALLALLAAAITTLIVPIAIRRMIDFGFSQQSANLIDSYFAVMIAVAAVLAVASAARFFFVTRLGERIVADLREEVFGHLVSLSPAYFDVARSGELISRLTADTTQIKAAV